MKVGRRYRWTLGQAFFFSPPSSDFLRFLEGAASAAGAAESAFAAAFLLALYSCALNDTVATLSLFIHETRGLSCGRVDDVEATPRVDAIAATTSSSSSFLL